MIKELCYPEIMSFLAVLVDDDEVLHQAIRLMLPPNWQLHGVTRLALLDPDILSKAHVLICDMHLSPSPLRAEGLEVLAQVHEVRPELPLMAISGDLSLHIMEEGLRRGARYFLAKPINAAEMQHRLGEIEQYWHIQQLMNQSDASVVWIGQSSASRHILTQISRLRLLSHPVLIEGETGVGKEVCARLLAKPEPAPFVAVNVASIPENLFESEFFGYQKGAFTGADHSKPGLVEQAQGGTLFLDEIEALPLSQQAKLLRFLESYEGRRVGSNQNYKVQTRVIAASNIPLEKLVNQDQFRQDLYFRLSQAVIRIPPLRERKEDIPLLINFFSRNWQDRFPKVWSTEAIEHLKNYHFPGNIRELKKLVELMHTQAPLPIVRPEDLSPWLTSTESQSFATESHKIGQRPPSHPDSNPVTPPEIRIQWEYDWQLGYDENIYRFEKQLWEEFLRRYKPSELWWVLKIPRSSFYKKLKSLGLVKDES